MGRDRRDPTGQDHHSAAARRLGEIALLKTVTIFVVVLCTFSALFAQTRTITGHVQDQNGAAVSGADVSLLNNGQPFLTSTTDDSGFFRFANISGSVDRIRVTHAGFTRFETPLSSDQLEISLAPTAISEIVTVTHTDSRLSDTPQSVLILNSDELRSDPAPTLDEKLRQVPGFTLFRRSGSQAANPTSQGVSLRGTGGSGASRAAVTLDGFPLNDPFGGWVYWGRVPLESVNDVQVLRGSAGEVIGSSAIGGIVAVAERSSRNGSSFDIDTSYGSQNTWLGSLFAASGAGPFKFSLAAEGFRTDGFIAVDKTQRGTVDTQSGVKRSSFLPKIEYRFSEGKRVFAIGEYFQERRANGTPLQNNDTKSYSIRSGADVDSRRFGAVALRGWLSSQIYHQSFSSIAVDRNSELLTRLQTVPSSSTGASVQWSKTFSDTVNFYAGSEFRIVRGSSDEIAFAAGRPTSLVNSGGREATAGTFVGGSYLPTKRLVFSGGVRVDHWREYSAYSETRPLNSAVTTRSAFPDRSETAVSPRVSALFRVNSSVSLTANYSRGFRQPTLNELYRSFRVGNVLTLANENLKAERASTGEGGVLLSAFSNKIYLRTVGFCTFINEPVANVTLSSTPALITRQRQNLGQTRSCGLEADGQFRLTKELEFSAGYLFVEPRVTRFPADRSFEGLRVPQVAKDQFTSQIRYDRPDIASITLQLRASDAQFDDDQNQFRLAGFATVDAFVLRRINRSFEIYLAAENIFNDKVEAGRTPVLTLASPRTLRVGVRINFSSGRRT
jgi:outer membrane receptor protein involved in Fe transport